MKQFLILISILLFISCKEQNTATSSLTRYIPRKASVIIKTQDLKGFTASVKNNDLLKALGDTDIYSFFKNQQSYVDRLSPKGETLICYTKTGKNEYDISVITKAHPELFTTDSTYVTTQLNSTKPAISKTQTPEVTFYSLIINEVYIISTSQLLLENAVRETENTVQDPSFERAYQAAGTNAEASFFIKGEEAGGLWSSFFPRFSGNPLQDTFSWSLADLNLSNNDIQVNGVTLVQDSIGQRLELLKDTHPQVNKTAEITPLTSAGFVSVTYDNWETYKNNLALFRKLDPSKFQLREETTLASFNEIGLIYTDTGNAIVGYSSDPVTTEETLSGSQEETGSFRQVSLRKFATASAFAKAFSPLLTLPDAKVYCKLDDFYVFAETTATLETIIANYQNKATFSQSASYGYTAARLSSASSILMVSNIGKKSFVRGVQESDKKPLNALALDNYPFAALQLIQERDFMHLNGLINKNEQIADEGAVTQAASVKLDNALAHPPQLVKNHRTKGMDIVVQDINNNLYLISNTGKILWQKALDSPILGEIKQVDLYRNGRLQLAFTTANTFYILDRNGKEVSPFPIQFKDIITQPLAVFDYENNRNYRFIVIQGSSVSMYDKNAKNVTGFTFNKAASEIIFAPEHLRIGTKDYIAIAESSGKLNILNRTGKHRITINDNIAFGDTFIHKEKNTFVVYDINGAKLTITPNGKFTKGSDALGSDSNLTVLGTHKASLRDNTLMINGKKVTLEYGTYTAPVIFKVGKKIYVSCTNTEASQVFLFDSKGQAIEHFPVYGVAPIDMDFLERSKNTGFVTQGDEQTILIYRIN